LLCLLVALHHGQLNSVEDLGHALEHTDIGFRQQFGNIWQIDCRKHHRVAEKHEDAQGLIKGHLDAQAILSVSTPYLSSLTNQSCATPLAAQVAHGKAEELSAQGSEFIPVRLSEFAQPGLCGLRGRHLVASLAECLLRPMLLESAHLAELALRLLVRPQVHGREPSVSTGSQ
jgi:hypothetical protein